MSQTMAINAKGLFSNNFAIATIVFSILLILLVVFAIMKINLIATLVVLFLAMLVGIFGILPHAFEEMK